MSIRVDLLEPPAYARPYDHALAAALAREGAQVQLITSPFAFGEAPVPDGYLAREIFYRRAVGAAGSKLRSASKLALHVPQMMRYARAVGAAPEARPGQSSLRPDVVHVQWLTVPWLDLRLLPKLPTVLTIHDPLGRGPLPGPKPDLSRLDAVVVHSDYARAAVICEHALDPGKVHVIRHGVLGGAAPGPLPPELPATELPVVLCFGLIRPYKGVEILLQAWDGITDAELWIVGRPMMDITELRAAAPTNVRFVPRFVTAAQEAALYQRADIVVLPYERSDRFGFSGVLATALGLGKAIVLSEVGGLAEVSELGAARGVPPSDRAALHAALAELVADEQARTRLAAKAAAAAADVYSWEAAARETIALYRTILGSGA
jgi:glycosyltransferase involved in cell wall biosynthesis